MLNAKCKATLVCLTILLMNVSLLQSVSPVKAQEPLFHITLMTPSTNPARQQWALVIQSNLISVGIDAERWIADWGTIFDRALVPSLDILGKTHDEGGFDALFVGYAMGINPDPYGLYDSSQFAPTGQNYYLWNSTENDRLCRLIKETVNETLRLQYVKEWQELAYQELPSITIFYTQEIVAFNPAIENGKEIFFLYHYPAWPPIWNVKGLDTLVLAQTGPAPSEGLADILSTSYYDLTVYAAVFNGLAQRNDTISKSMLPALAESWTVADDDKTWTVKLRKGVKFHDGVEFTAEDVKFTFDAYMTPELASPLHSFVLEIIGGKENVKIIDPYTVEFHLPVPYAYFVEVMMAAFMLPKHVLEDVPWEDWRTHTFFTGQGSYTVETPTGTYTAYGPIGTGPYVYMGYDPATLTNHLVRNDNYFDWPWHGKSDLQARGEFTVKDYYVVFIEGLDPAITALKDGSVDVLDSQYHIEAVPEHLDSMVAEGWGDWVTYDAYGLQELGINMKHPILGTGVDTPLGKEDPTRAAEAARYVRQAISHLIPRDMIIDQLLNGYGMPAVTTPVTRVTAGFNEELSPYEFNATRARELLTLAGYETGIAPPPTFWELYGIYIAGILGGGFVVVLALYFVRRKQTST